MSEKVCTTCHGEGSIAQYAAPGRPVLRTPCYSCRGSGIIRTRMRQAPAARASSRWTGGWANALMGLIVVLIVP